MNFFAGIAASAMCLVSVTAQAGRLKSFDYPGGKPTCGLGLSSIGTVVGNNFTLSAPTDFFTWRDGHFTTLSPALPAGFVSISGINRHGVLAGSVTTVSSSFIFQSMGFTLHGTKVTTVNLPRAFSVAATGINDSGLIVGYTQTSQGGPTLGFVTDGKHTTTLDGGTGTTLPVAIDASGSSVVGMTQATDPAAGTVTLSGFLYRDHHFTAIAYPGATTTFAYGLSSPDVVYGTYFAGSGTSSVEHGFIYRHGTYKSFDVAGASATQVAGANASGQFTGCYTDAKGTHGFVFTP